MFSKARKPEAKPRSQNEKGPGKQKVPSIISADLQISGNLKTDGDVQIDGVVDGDVESNLLTIGDSAVVNGCVVGEIIRVAGTVNGEITGRVVELTRSARITGDINHHSLAIEAGAFVQGLCRRIDPKQIDARPVLEAAKPNLIVAGPDGKTDKSDKKDDNPKSVAG
jgi:cytoskeletal protein CcmA (bactofilin family)